jgi:predicted enzyme related to lactoylglutathione lyase
MADNPAFRPDGITYLRIPAPDAQQAATFYRAVFGWTITVSNTGDRPEPSFADGTGHVIGHFMPNLLVVGEAGVLPYVYVDSVSSTLTKVTANGGDIARKPYPEGDLTVATFRDPAGNIIGLWQRATP